MYDWVVMQCTLIFSNLLSILEFFFFNASFVLLNRFSEVEKRWECTDALTLLAKPCSEWSPNWFPSAFR